jgi:acyl transferase domain-containing protein
MLDGTSQHRELIPNDRFVMESTHRPREEGSEKKKWYGNFLDDTAVFDHKFFKKSPREALHMDPQQRLILQTAYQAVAQSGYYFQPKRNKSSDRRIGCYIGAVTNDYEYNISHAIPNAFSATGALRSYIAGKVSHFFGWTGPAMTLDTACSASTVAIDLAIQAILSGECSAALYVRLPTLYRSTMSSVQVMLTESADVSQGRRNQSLQHASVLPESGSRVVSQPDWTMQTL